MYTHDKILPVYTASYTLPYNLGRLPALRHFKIQVPAGWYNISTLSFLQRWFSSSPSGIETLGIEITCDHCCIEDLFSPQTGARLSRLDEILTGEKFVSLRKVILAFSISMMIRDYNKLEFKNLIVSYVNNTLFPLTSRQRTLETSVDIC
jgi:hypothetical protein